MALYHLVISKTSHLMIRRLASFFHLLRSFRRIFPFFIAFTLIKIKENDRLLCCFLAVYLVWWVPTKITQEGLITNTVVKNWSIFQWNRYSSVLFSNFICRMLHEQNTTILKMYSKIANFLTGQFYRGKKI